MSVRRRIVLALSALAAFYTFLSWVVLRQNILPGFIATEQEEIEAKAAVVVDELHQELAALLALTRKKAQALPDVPPPPQVGSFPSDPPETGNHPPIPFPREFMHRNHLLFACISHDQKRVSVGRTMHSDDFREFYSLGDLFRLDALDCLGTDAFRGVLDTTAATCLVVSLPLPETKGGGRLIMGRALQRLATRISAECSNFQVRLLSLSQAPLAGWLKVPPASIPPYPERIFRDLPDDHGEILTLIPAGGSDISGKEAPALLLRGRFRQRISTTGSRSIQYAFLSNVALSVSLLFSAMALLQILVVRPVEKISRCLQALNSTQDLSIRFPEDLSGEFQELGTGANQILASLQHLITEKDTTAQERDRLLNELEERVASRTAGLESIIAAHRRTEAELQRSQSMYSALVSRLPEIVFVHRDGIVHWANETAEICFGTPPGGLVGYDIFKFAHTQDISTIFTNFKKRKQGEVLEDYEIRILPPGRPQMNVIVRATPVDFADDPDMVLVILIDITKRKEAEQTLQEREEHIRRITDNVKDIVFEINREGRISYMSPSVKSLGYSPLQLEGRDLLELVHPEDRNALRRTFSQAIERGAVTQETRFAAHNGDIRWMEIILSRIPGGEDTSPKVVGGARDVTDFRKAEELHLQAQRAKAAAEAKGEFLANMSHEIRTPMNAVIGFADLLAKTTLDEKQRDYLETSRQAAKHLMSVLNQILDFSKID